jgi:hypothetical protein
LPDRTENQRGGFAGPLDLISRAYVPESVDAAGQVALTV